MRVAMNDLTGPKDRVPVRTLQKSYERRSSRKNRKNRNDSGK